VRSSGRPNAFVRLRRNGLATVGVIVVGCLAIALSGVSDALHVRLTGQVDSNWRGAYDILVRPGGTRLDLERTNGLVEPNFLSYSGHGGISLSQLDAIRAVAGVQLAAPVSFLGYMRYATSSPTIQLTELPPQPTLYRATVTVTTSDGLTDRLLQRESGRVLIGPQLADGSADPHWAADFYGMTYGVDPSGNPILDFPANHDLPAIAIPVMAVDPSAERELLGSTATFLDDFDELPDRDNLTVGNMNVDLIPPTFDFARTQITLLRDPNYPTPAAKSRPIVPLVLSDNLYAGLKLTLDVSQIGVPLHAYPPGDVSTGVLDGAERAAGGGTTSIGHTTLDAGADLRPFQPASLILAWPGSSPAGGALGIANFGTLETRLSERPSYITSAPRPGSSRPAFQIVPQGLVGPDDAPTTVKRDPSGPTTAYAQGAFPAYRSFVSVPLALDTKGVNTSAFDNAFIFAPLGTFDLAKLDLPANPLNRVPLGAYAPPDTTLVADPSGSPLAAKSMTPTLSPAGLIASPPLAITDLVSARLLRGENPIDAIRVRVAGLSGFDGAAQNKVEAVASQIAALGLDVDIVAGSSPQSIDLYVPRYDVSTDPPGDLGWVSQDWTTIGAAQRVERGFGQSDLTLLSLGLLAAVVFAFGLQVLQLARRAQEISIQRAIGWSRRQILGWLLGEALIGTVAIAVLAIVGWWVGGRSTSALATGLLLSGIWLSSAIVGALVAEQSAGIDRLESGEVAVGRAQRRSLPVRNVTTFALRSAVTRSTRTVIEVVGLAVAGATVGLSVVTLAIAASSGGPTFLAAAVGASLSGLQLGILLGSSACSFAFVVAATWLNLASRRPEMEILQATGWSDQSMRRLIFTERALVAIPAAIAGTLITLSAGPNLGLGSLVPLSVGIAVVTAVATPLAVAELARSFRHI
jgi:hypothetical protein